MFTINKNKSVNVLTAQVHNKLSIYQKFVLSRLNMAFSLVSPIRGTKDKKHLDPTKSCKTKCE